MKKHYLISAVMICVGIWCILTTGDNTTTYIALTIIFIIYPFIIDAINKDYDKYMEDEAPTNNARP